MKRPRLLFLCVANSARSQMAEGLARYVFGAELAVSSAGSKPTHLNPLSVEAMAELDIDISHHRSSSVTELDAGAIDIVITLFAEEVCPVILSEAKRLHWPLSDPDSSDDPTLTHGQRLDRFREARNEIYRRIVQLKEEGGVR